MLPWRSSSHSKYGFQDPRLSIVQPYHHRAINIPRDYLRHQAWAMSSSFSLFKDFLGSIICVHDHQEQYLRVTYNIQGQSNHHLVVIKWEHGPSNHLRVLWPHQATNDHKLGHWTIWCSNAHIQCPRALSSLTIHTLAFLLWLHVMSSHFTFVIRIVINDNPRQPYSSISPLSLMATNISFLSPFDINYKGLISLQELHNVQEKIIFWVFLP